MGLIISTTCSKSHDVFLQRPVHGSVLVEKVHNHGTFTGTMAEIMDGKCSGGGQKCMVFSKEISAEAFDKQITIASDGGQSSTPYQQKITTRVGAF